MRLPHLFSAPMAVAVAALTCFAATASADARPPTADCSVQRPLVQPFLPWLDHASYALAPDGGIEAGAAGWLLDGGASVVDGNEAFSVNDPGDAASLALPAGSSATTPGMCVGAQWPAVRLFARSDADVGSSLGVEVLFTDESTGGARALSIGTVRPSPTWQPTDPMVLAVNALGALRQDGMIPVALRFTPAGAGTWQIDDVFVDPFRGP